MLKRALFPFSFGSRCRSNRYGIVVGVTRRAVAIAERIATSAKQSFQTQVAQAVGIDVPSDVFDAEVRPN